MQKLVLPTTMHAQLYIPNFHHHTGLNDRLAYGTKEAILHYTSQFAHMPETRFDASKATTEAWLCDHIIQRSQLQIGLMQACFHRYRTSGKAEYDNLISRHRPYECIARGCRFVPNHADFDACPGDLEDVRLAANVTVAGDSMFYAMMLTQKCQTVVFTTLIYSQGSQFRLPSVPWSNVCFRALVSSHVRQWLNEWEQWRPIVIRLDTPYPRLASKLLKTSFFSFFHKSVSRVVFVDAKLHLHESVSKVIGLTHRDILFFKHPCASEPKLSLSMCRYKGSWRQHEINLVLARNRTDDTELLRNRVRQLQTRTLQTSLYADTALFATRRSFASKLFFSQWHSLIRNYSIDRDQFTLPFVRHSRHVVYHDTVPPKCASMCSWWLQPVGYVQRRTQR